MNAGAPVMGTTPAARFEPEECRSVYRLSLRVSPSCVLIMHLRALLLALPGLLVSADLVIRQDTELSEHDMDCATWAANDYVMFEIEQSDPCWSAERFASRPTVC